MNFTSLVRPDRTSAPEVVDRLTADDDLFVRMDVVLGLPVVNQTLWRFPGTVDVDTITALGQKLRYGRLSRLVTRHRGPGRAYWRYTPEAGAVSVQTEPVPAGDEEAWGRAQADAPLDFENGPAWRLVVARAAADDSVLVSLIISHVIADGGTGAVAVIEAIHGLDYVPGAEPGLVSDVRDAADLLGGTHLGYGDAVRPGGNGGGKVIGVPRGVHAVDAHDDFTIAVTATLDGCHGIVAGSHLRIGGNGVLQIDDDAVTWQ